MELEIGKNYLCSMNRIGKLLRKNVFNRKNYHEFYDIEANTTFYEKLKFPFIEMIKTDDFFVGVNRGKRKTYACKNGILAYAICHNLDEFNAEVGTQLAIERVKVKNKKNKVKEENSEKTLRKVLLLLSCEDDFVILSKLKKDISFLSVEGIKDRIGIFNRIYSKMKKIDQD